MARSRKKPGRKDELRNEIKLLDGILEIAGHMRLNASEKLRQLEAKPKRKRKRPAKCQPHDERIQAAFRLPDTVPAIRLSELH